MVVVIEQLYSDEDRRRAVHYPFATHRQQTSYANKKARKGETASQQANRAILGAHAEGQGLGLDDDGSSGEGEVGSQGVEEVDVSSLDHKKRLERWQKQSHPIHADEYHLHDGIDEDDDDDLSSLSMQLNSNGSNQGNSPSRAP